MNIQTKLPFYIFTVIFLSITTGFSQQDDDIQASFFAISGGLNASKYNSSERLFDDSKIGTGYNLALSHYLTPDFAYDTFFFRTSLSFISEKSEAGKTILYQNIPVISKADDKFIGIHLFGGYRFDPESKLDAYLGGGLFFQTRINDPDKALIFVTDTGEEFPIYTEDPSAPLQFQNEAPGSVLGIELESGSFFEIANNIATVGIGLRYGFFLSKNSESLSLDKTTFYFNFWYQLY